MKFKLGRELSRTGSEPSSITCFALGSGPGQGLTYAAARAGREDHDRRAAGLVGIFEVTVTLKK